MNNTNAYFTIEDNFYLIDCGFTSFQNVIQLDDFKNTQTVTIFVTHLHADHAGSLPMLVSYCLNIMKIKCSIVFPLTTVKDLLLLMGIPDNEYDYYPSWNHIGKKGKLEVEVYEVDHTPLMKCFSYSFTYEKSTFYISGDSATIPEKVIFQFKEGEIDRIYQDTMSGKGLHPSHGTLQMLDSIFTPDLRNRVFCTHYNKDFRSTIREHGYGIIYEYSKN
ncbi:MULTISPECIES: MBL fold metallo-hydrolase [unclassified Oceanispirochaeta]|uniref:MBL fold metallo-hydrolase n=1 Tax=unclassified Oceanispirochaeta TaxID=2635722 RepID=UPI00131483F4|nr:MULTISPECIES: MBL fold metallo-hydrolase [unclassified Oceanispirochaeta]MBF9016738.1 MBL fold metallo-hydrolase [Oceanispirochaeta sp. M2]NPD72008.1 MBL fold metallo-hydrolase [Oceanispirochaeta sp. M1]